MKIREKTRMALLVVMVCEKMVDDKHRRSVRMLYNSNNKSNNGVQDPDHSGIHIPASTAVTTLAHAELALSRAINAVRCAEANVDAMESRDLVIFDWEAFESQVQRADALIGEARLEVARAKAAQSKCRRAFWELQNGVETD
jgi:hypothetical protein